MSKTANEKTAARLALAAGDMEDVLGYLAALQELEEGDRLAGTSAHHFAKEAIFLGAMVVYSRSFFRSQGSEADELLRPGDMAMFSGRPELESLHNVIYDLRRQAVAHSDWKHHKSVIAPMTKPDRFRRETSRPDYRRDVDTTQFVELVRHVQQFTYLLSYMLDVTTVTKQRLTRTRIAPKAQ